MAVSVTHNWSDSTLSRATAAHESFVITGVTTRIDALNANGPPYGPVPHRLNSHPEDPLLFALPPVAKIIVPGTEFQVDIDYGPFPLAIGIAPEDPRSEPPKFSWGDEEETEPVDIDLFGNPLVTSNGDAIDPSPELVLTTKIIRVTKWVEEFDLDLCNNFEWTTNDDPIQIPLCSGTIPESCLLCRSIIPISTYDERAAIIQMQMLFALRFFGWRWRFLDVGTRGWYKDTDNKIKIGEFFTKLGTQVTAPVRLNGKGKPYNSDAIIIEKSAKTAVEIGQPSGATTEDTGSAIFLKYFRYNGNDFSGLGIF